MPSRAAAIGCLVLCVSLLGTYGPPTASAVSGSQAPVAVPDTGRSPPDAATARRFASAMTSGLSKRATTASIGALMQHIGRQFEGAPYLEGTLDAPPRERLVVRLDGFDCVTFVETVFAMARGVMANDTTYAGFARRLEEQRYRGGRLQGYCSRLHYFTEWLSDNEARGLVERLGESFGGRSLADSLDFMSTHRSAYDRFATVDSLYACVQDMEAALQRQHHTDSVRYVPQDSIRAVYDKLRAGDIVALVTSIDGLDVAHTGLVYASEDGGHGLLHASLSEGVVVSPDLQRYVRKIDHQIGMVVARPQPVP